MAGRVAVAMSGGLDSSVVAWLLSREQEDVVGFSMLLWNQSGEATHGRCCSALDLLDAQRVAHQCGIPHFTLRLEEDFRRLVVDPFVEDYLQGRTPNPCARCNTWVKFASFLDRARAAGAESIATGHYARILEGPEGLELHRAADTTKDQSYYLFELNQDQLASTLFPLGELTKENVRGMAREAGLTVAEKGESMEICFVSGGVEEFVEQQIQENPGRFSVSPTAEPSRLVTANGEEVGRGRPYYRYTVGQRRGLGVAAREPLYVLGIEHEENRVVVGPERDLEVGGLVGERVHWIGSEPDGDVDATVKIRSRHPGCAARIRPLGDGDVEVKFVDGQRGVAPGQACVFYQDTRVLGGCWIRSPQGSG